MCSIAVCGIASPAHRCRRFEPYLCLSKAAAAQRQSCNRRLLQLAPIVAILPPNALLLPEKCGGENEKAMEWIVVAQPALPQAIDAGRLHREGRYGER